MYLPGYFLVPCKRNNIVFFCIWKRSMFWTQLFFSGCTPFIFPTSHFYTVINPETNKLISLYRPWSCRSYRFAAATSNCAVTGVACLREDRVIDAMGRFNGSAGKPTSKTDYSLTLDISKDWEHIHHYQCSADLFALVQTTDTCSLS